MSLTTEDRNSCSLDASEAGTSPASPRTSVSKGRSCLHWLSTGPAGRSSTTDLDTEWLRPNWA